MKDSFFLRELGTGRAGSNPLASQTREASRRGFCPDVQPKCSLEMSDSWSAPEPWLMIYNAVRHMPIVEQSNRFPPVITNADHGFERVFVL